MRKLFLIVVRLLPWFVTALFIGGCFWIGLSILGSTAAWIGGAVGCGAVLVLALACCGSRN